MNLGKTLFAQLMEFVPWPADAAQQVAQVAELADQTCRALNKWAA